MRLNGSVQTKNKLNKMLTIKAKAIAGATIENTFKEAQEIAKKLNCYVEFQFNEVKCCASPKGDAYTGTCNYHYALKNDTKFAFDF